MRLPGVQFTVRSMMIAVAVFAAFAAWTQGGEYAWRQHLNTEITWSQSPEGQFLEKHGFERGFAR